jgi:hypothetical protein
LVAFLAAFLADFLAAFLAGAFFAVFFAFATVRPPKRKGSGESSRPKPPR